MSLRKRFKEESSMGGRTVSARLDEKTVWELEFLKSWMGDKKTTEILTEAIHHLYATQNQKKPMNALDFLKEIGFIGAAEGDADDSLQYKKQISKRIRKKR